MMIEKLCRSQLILKNMFMATNQKPTIFKPKATPSKVPTIKGGAVKQKKGELSLSSAAQRLKMDEASLRKQLSNSTSAYINQEQLKLLSMINGRQFSLSQQNAQSSMGKKSPVVTIMGHVDHGKTTLIDYLRQSTIADHEVGGITQKIGAFHIICHNQKITFIDTPGHQAFSNMRQRGARVTDLIILIVSATEGVKKQTQEVINIINRDQVETIVAINKIDLPNANVEEVEDSLFEAGLNIEPKGGNIQVVHISAKTGKNVDLLSELILEQTSELKAVTEGQAEGIVLQAYQNTQGLNAMTLIVKQGILKSGSLLVIGDQFTKIKDMQDDSGNHLKKAYPGDAVQIFGIPTVPTAGDFVYEVEDEVKAKYIVSKRKEMAASETLKSQAKNTLKTSKLRLNYRTRKAMYGSASSEAWIGKFNEKQLLIQERLQRLRSTEQSTPQMQQLIAQTEEQLRSHKQYVFQFLVNIGQNKNNFNVVLKFADRGIQETVHEQIAPIIERLKQRNKMTVNILKSDVGEVTLNDLEEAATCNADIFTFGCEANLEAAQSIKQFGVNLKVHRLIHTFLKDFEESAINRKKVLIKGVEKGRGLVADVFVIKGKKGSQDVSQVPGIRVESGKLSKSNKIFVFRNGVPATEGMFPRSIKVFKKETSQVKKGEQCTIKLDTPSDFTFQKGDELVGYQE